MKKLNLDKVLKLFPMDKPREAQVYAISQAVTAYNNGAKYVVMDAPTGCHGPGTPIMLATGETVPVESVQVGDRLMGWRGPVTVTELKRGTQPMFNIVPVKGAPFTVNLDHVLTLVHTETGAVVDVSLRNWFEWSAYKVHCHKLFRTAVPTFEVEVSSSRTLPIDPYVLGLLLGDGALTKGVIVCKRDMELEAPLREEAADHGITYFFDEKYGEHHLAVPRGSGRNPLYDKIRELGLTVTSEFKFIPEQYKKSSYKVREEVLAGILDTDGHLSNNCFDYISKSRQLAEDVTFVARSVGLAAYLTPCEKYDQNGQGGMYFRVSLSGDLERIPTRIARKRAQPRAQKKDILRTGFTVEALGEGEFFGFSLDTDPHYLLGDFTVTHNTGKSGIAVTLGRSFNESYMLTLTEQLQEQYLKDFEKHGLATLKGRGKFTCTNGGGSLSCATGKVMFGAKCKACPYKAAKEKALASPHVVANYHSFLFNVGGPMKAGLELQGTSAESANFEDGVSPVRPLMVVDEVHSAESFLLDQIGVTVKLSRMPFMTPKPPEDIDNPDPYWRYIKEELLNKLFESIQKTPDPGQKEELRMLYGRLSSAYARKDKVEWIPERERVEGSTTEYRSDSFTLKPLTVDLWGPWIHAYGERLLLMSGTVLDAHTLVTSLGLDPSEGEHVEVPSPFPKENRPIYAGKFDMSYKARKETWPLMVKTIDQLLSAHAKEKGLILPQSNEMAKFIKKNLSYENAQRIVIASGEDRMKDYWEHVKGNRPTVLCAPGFWEGADLKGDASRFQVIPALPRAPWQGQIKARASRSDRWYRWLTMTKTLQGLGRSVRSETDECVSYILDRDFIREMNRKDTLIPKWVAEAVEEVS